jgi:hypothetical protein
MSAFVNYFAPLAQDEKTPITQEPVWSGLHGHRRLARIARRRTIERQRTQDAQVEQYELLTRNNNTPPSGRHMPGIGYQTHLRACMQGQGSQWG